MLEAADDSLRVCALYPELMNIYADRGNIAVLRARCEWRGHRLRAGRVGASASRSTPSAARPLLHGRRPGPRPGRGGRRTWSTPSATRFTPPPTRGAVVLAVCGGYQLLGPRVPARRRGAARRRAGRPAHGARAGPAADRQLRDRGRPRRRPAGDRRLREPRRAHLPRRGRAAARPGARRASATTATTASRACAAAT